MKASNVCLCLLRALWNILMLNNLSVPYCTPINVHQASSSVLSLLAILTTGILSSLLTSSIVSCKANLRSAHLTLSGSLTISSTFSESAPHFYLFSLVPQLNTSTREPVSSLRTPAPLPDVLVSVEDSSFHQ